MDKHQLVTKSRTLSGLGVWPSEEVMAHYCLQKRHMFKWVLPLFKPVLSIVKYSIVSKIKQGRTAVIN